MTVAYARLGDRTRLVTHLARECQATGRAKAAEHRELYIPGVGGCVARTAHDETVRPNADARDASPGSSYSGRAALHCCDDHCEPGFVLRDGW